MVSLDVFSAFTRLFSWFGHAVVNFLMSEPVIYFVGLFCLAFAIKILYSIIGHRRYM